MTGKYRIYRITMNVFCISGISSVVTKLVHIYHRNIRCIWVESIVLRCFLMKTCKNASENNSLACLGHGAFCKLSVIWQYVVRIEFFILTLLSSLCEQL